MSRISTLTVSLFTFVFASIGCNVPDDSPGAASLLNERLDVPRSLSELVDTCDQPDEGDAAARCGLGREMLVILSDLLERRNAGYPGGPSEVELDFEQNLRIWSVPEETILQVHSSLDNHRNTAGDHARALAPVTSQSVAANLSHMSMDVLSQIPADSADEDREVSLRVNPSYQLSVIGIRSEKCADDWGNDPGECDIEELSVQWAAWGPNWSYFDNTNEVKEQSKVVGYTKDHKPIYRSGGAFFSSNHLVPSSKWFSHNPVFFVWRVRENDPGGDINWVSVGLAAAKTVSSALGKNWFATAAAGFQLIAELAKFGNPDDFYDLKFSLYSPNGLAQITSGTQEQHIPITFFDLPNASYFVNSAIYNTHVGGYKVITGVTRF